MILLFTLIFKKIDQALFKVNFAGDKDREDYTIFKNSIIKLLQLRIIQIKILLIKIINQRLLMKKIMIF